MKKANQSGSEKVRSGAGNANTVQQMQPRASKYPWFEEILEKKC